MKIAENTVVAFHYTLKDDQGNQLDSSQGQEPLSYLHGAGNIVPGLEEALEGRVQGDQFQVSVPPERGYGLRDEDMVQTLPKSAFQSVGQLDVGMQFQAATDHGPVVITVTAVNGDDVVVDGNHPLAGATLHFQIEVVNVRNATDEELEHGHVHTGHCH